LALWFLYTIIRYLDATDIRTQLLILTLGAMLSLALYLCKSSAIFLPFAFGMLLVAETIRFRDWRWDGTLRLAVFGGLFSCGYLIYNALFMIFNRLDAFAASEFSVLFRYFNPALHLPYIVLTLLLYLLIFSVTTLVFPVLLPLLHLREFEEREQFLTLYALTALIFGALIIVLSVSLGEDFPNPLPRIHLRYLFPLIFLWLPLSIKALLDYDLSLKRRALTCGLAGVALPYYLLVTDCNALIEYDAPARVLISFCKNSALGMAAAYGGVRLLAVSAMLLGGYALLRLPKRTSRAVVLLGCYAVFCSATGFRLQPIVAYPLTPFHEELLSEIRAIGAYLAENPGEILLLCNDPRGDAYLEPYLPREYFLIWDGAIEVHDFLWQTQNGDAAARGDLPVHVQYSFLENRLAINGIRYLICCGSPQNLSFAPDSLMPCPIATKTYPFYEFRDPELLSPHYTLSGPPTKDQSWVDEYRLRQAATANRLLLTCQVQLEEQLPPSGAELVIQWNTQAMTLPPEFDSQEIVVRLHSSTVPIAHEFTIPHAPEGEMFCIDLNITVRDDEGNPLRFKLNNCTMKERAPR